jgi:hypothetical protein
LFATGTSCLAEVCVIGRSRVPAPRREPRLSRRSLACEYGKKWLPLASLHAVDCAIDLLYWCRLRNRQVRAAPQGHASTDNSKKRAAPGPGRLSSESLTAYDRPSFQSYRQRR